MTSKKKKASEDRGDYKLLSLLSVTIDLKSPPRACSFSTLLSHSVKVKN